MNLLAIIRDWQARRRKRNAARVAAAQERRRAALLRQIAEAKEARREWKPKLGELRAATLAALIAENELLRG